MRLLTAIFLLIFAASAQAAIIDSLLIRDSVKATAIKKADTTGFKMKKDPTLALILSAIVPGAGQVYVGDWYKTPFILGAFAGCFYAASIQNTRYHYTADSVRNQLARGDEFNASRYTSVREFYRDDRDKWYIYAALVYIANLIDAYIAAHLFDFDVSDATTKTAFLAAPASSQEPWRLGFSVHF
ncbi:MAG TPA: DUF5683 domain-containing protein [Candidatus Kapabacteria bacterium]|nr:DUF5683 domain-containing protein [Candidatus Kapabacteria bacterium]